MIMKELGRSGILVGAVGQGTAYPKKKLLSSSRELIRILEAGIDYGMALIDTAEVYGDGLAEELISEVIKGRRSKVIIATKFLPEHSSSSGVIYALENSLKRLGTDYVDLYQFHWPNPEIPLAETAVALEQCVRAGKARFIGASNFSRRELEAFDGLSKEIRLVSLQTEYNVLERSPEYDGTLDYCIRKQTSILAYSPLDQGRIGDLNNAERIILEQVAEKYAKTIAQIILRWLISRRPVIAIPMTADIGHVNENAESMRFDLSLEDIQTIDRIFDTPINFIPVEQIRVSLKGERGHKVYQTLAEAIANRMGFVPSPATLAEAIKHDLRIKPVRLAPVKDRSGDFLYDLINGRIRFWAWVIAHGNQHPIPAYVRDHRGGE